MASSGALVGGCLRFSIAPDIRERDDADEEEGVSSVGDRAGGVPGVEGSLSLATSLEIRALSRGLGAADTPGVAAGLGRTL